MMTTTPDFTTARVLVMGDVMVDRYWAGPAERISPEAPVPVVRVDEVNDRCGGAANVAFNLARLGAQVSLIGAIGNDSEGSTLLGLLREAGVNCQLAASPEIRTTLKLRLLSQHHQLMRLDFEQNASRGQVEAMGRAFDEELARHDVVVFSDYGKGVLADISTLIDRCRMLGRITVVDPWGPSFDRYRRATIITPNAREFAATVGEPVDDDDVERRARVMVERLDLAAVLVTQGHRGMTLFARDISLHIPSEAREVFDVTGAGDTVVAALAAGLGSGLPLEASARLANRAAGVVVGRLGTAAVTPGDLADGRILSVAQLVEAAARARLRGHRVVMTNGCFDIIHAGHVAYLAEAATLGDRLAIAVNSDASVRRLKGPGRPINPIGHRLAVLAALRHVDWVTEFDGTETPDGFEDTPRALVAAVQPDILVKGGDYLPEAIVGADAVRAHGGHVQTIPLLDGVSTSAIVARIKGPAV